MIATPLFAVVPLIWAAVPVAAVPQKFWNAYCAEAVTLTETVSLPATSPDADDPQATAPPKTVIQTVTLYTSLAVAPTAESDAISAAEAEDLPRPTKIGGGTAETVTVFSTVTDVSTVTIQAPQPSENSGSASAKSPGSNSGASPDSNSAVSPESSSKASPESNSAVSPESNAKASPESSNSAVSPESNSEASLELNLIEASDPTKAVSSDAPSDPEDSPRGTATAVPPAPIDHPYYANDTQAAPYNTSQPTNNTSSSVAPPIIAPYDNSSQPTNSTSSSVLAPPVIAPYDNSTRSTNTSDNASPAMLTAAALAAPYDNSSQLMNATDTSPPVVALTAAAVPSDNSSTTDTASATPIPSVSVPVDNSSQVTTTSDTTYPPPTANPSAFGSALSSFEATSNTNDTATLSETTYSTYDSTYTPTDTWSGSQGFPTIAQLAGDASAPATPTSGPDDNSSQLANDTSLPAAPIPTAFGYGAYENGVYFTNWGIYAADYQPQSLPSSLITRVIYAFADFGPDGTVVSSDTFADLQNQYPTDPLSEDGNNAYGCVKQLYLLKKQNRRLKVLLSIGGWTYSTQFPAVAADQGARQTFAASAVQLVTDWGFDGIEIDWEYPSSADDAANFVLLLAAVRSELDVWAAQYAPGYHFLLTIASPAGPATYGIMDLEGMDAYVDSWNLMAYDYAGSWDTTTGHQANLYPEPNDALATKFNTDQAVDDYLSAGISPSKIVLGMPTFGRSFEATAGLGKPFTGVGPGSARLKQPGLWLYKELPRAGATELYDDVAMASYSYNNVSQELISYDNVYSAKVKKSYMLSKGLGGVIFWEASGDTNGTDSLVATLASNLGGAQYQQNWLNYSTSQYDNIRNGVPGP